MIAPSSGGLPVRSPKPNSVALTASQPYSQAVAAFDVDLVEVVVPVPLQPIAGHAHFVIELIDQLGDAPRQLYAPGKLRPKPIVSHSRIFADSFSGTCSLIRISRSQKGMIKPSMSARVTSSRWQRGRTPASNDRLDDLRRRHPCTPGGS